MSHLGHRRIVNTSALLSRSFCRRTEVFMILRTDQQLNLHFIINVLYIEIIHNLGKHQVFHFICYRINGFARVCQWKSGTASVNTDSQWSKQESCFARANKVWLAVNHNTSVTSGE